MVHEKQRNFSCPFEGCKRTCFREGQLQRHIRQKHEKRGEMQCPECPYRTVWKIGLQRHVDEVHKRVRYGCADCEFVSPRKDQVKNHAKKAHGRDITWADIGPMKA